MQAQYIFSGVFWWIESWKEHHFICIYYLFEINVFTVIFDRFNVILAVYNNEFIFKNVHFNDHKLLKYFRNLLLISKHKHFKFCTFIYFDNSQLRIDLLMSCKSFMHLFTFVHRDCLLSPQKDANIFLLVKNRQIDHVMTLFLFLKAFGSQRVCLWRREQRG